MGLDQVELIMRVEEEFQIEIPDKDAGDIVTVGNLYDYVMKKISNRLSQQCLTSRTIPN